VDWELRAAPATNDHVDALVAEESAEIEEQGDLALPDVCWSGVHVVEEEVDVASPAFIVHAGSEESHAHLWSEVSADGLADPRALLLCEAHVLSSL
jgi:hypothetical protein